jgi:FkbM family methyltransferase
MLELRYEPFLNSDDFRGMLTKTYDMNLIATIRNLLESGNTFVDVGANVGYVSAVAASIVGPQGFVHGFEPLRECVPHLDRLKTLNDGYNLHFNYCALASEPGELAISFDPEGDARQATLLPGKEYARSYSVDVMRFDDYAERNCVAVDLVKIDVEGFE